MVFSQPLIDATLVRRYKRFLADVRFSTGEVTTIHTPNTGSMLGCADPGNRIWVSDSQKPARRYRHTWEISETTDGVLVGVNTALANRLVREAIESGIAAELQGYDRIRPEIRYGERNSRIDLLLDRNGRPPLCFVEVKNVTAAVNNIAIFPDAKSLRAVKHMEELMAMRRQGHRAVVFFCVQRNDVREFRPADGIDPRYGAALREAIHSGVEALAYQAHVTHTGIHLMRRLPVLV